MKPKCTQCQVETEDRICFSYYDGNVSVYGRYCLTCALSHIVSVGKLVVAMMVARDKNKWRVVP